MKLLQALFKIMYSNGFVLEGNKKLGGKTPSVGNIVLSQGGGDRYTLLPF